MLSSKYGKDYVAEASSEALCRKWHVNENLIRCAPLGSPARALSAPLALLQEKPSPQASVTVKKI